jgi:hypothetical protein
MTSGRVSCEEVRELLPEYAEPGLRPAGPVEMHLARCTGCTAELAAYRSLLTSLTQMRSVEVEPRPAFVEDTLRAVRVESVRSRIPKFADVRRAGARVTSTLRDHGTGLRYALASLGGAAIGATAIAIVWWSIARRGLPPASIAGLSS